MKDTITVKSGDTLSAIAPRFGLSWQTLAEMNRDVIGDNPHLIYPRDVLRVRAEGVAKPGRDRLAVAKALAKRA